MKMAQAPGLVRKPCARPSHGDQGITIPTHSCFIAFLHPGYDDSSNTLLCMEPLDPGQGVYHATVLVACCILADN